MDDALLDHLEAALWAFLGKAFDFCLNLLASAGRTVLDIAAWLAGRIERVVSHLAAVPLWISLPVALLLVAAVIAYLLRQQLYDRLLIYHDIRLRRRGYSRQVFLVRRGAVQEVSQAMARRVPLPERFAAITVYEAEPDLYVVGYGQTAEYAEDVRFYRRDLTRGLAAMGEDLIQYFRATMRLLHADGELRALFAILDDRDPDFAVCRPRLPGEGQKKAVRFFPRTARHMQPSGRAMV